MYFLQQNFEIAINMGQDLPFFLQKTTFIEFKNHRNHEHYLQKRHLGATPFTWVNLQWSPNQHPEGELKYTHGSVLIVPCKNKFDKSVSTCNVNKLMATCFMLKKNIFQKLTLLILTMEFETVNTDVHSVQFALPLGMS